MKCILDWLQHNKEWVVSGVGVNGHLLAASLFCARFRYQRLKLHTCNNVLYHTLLQNRGKMFLTAK
jgi:hypothetical protein